MYYSLYRTPNKPVCPVLQSLSFNVVDLCKLFKPELFDHYQLHVSARWEMINETRH